jgi:hypothetical protein
MKKNNIISLEEISKEMPFSIPENYFSQFAEQIDRQVGYRKPITQRLHKSWMYMAATFVGILFMSGFFYSKYQQNSVKNSENYETYVMAQVDESAVVDYYMSNSSNNK